MSNIFKGIIISSMALLSLTFISCGDDDEEIEDIQPAFIEHLPSAENIKATTAFIPVNTSDFKGGVAGVHWGTKETGLRDDAYVFSGRDWDPNGFLITGLEPEQTYYYTIVYYPPHINGYVYSKEIKSFTTKAVSIKFTEPATIPMGNWSAYALRMQTSGIEEWDVPSNLHVEVYSAYSDNEFDNTIGICTTDYLGEGVWQYDAPDEEDLYIAVIKNSGGRIFAKTPIVRLVDGKLVEVEDNHTFDEILLKN